jgi:hypothetical protein
LMPFSSQPRCAVRLRAWRVACAVLWHPLLSCVLYVCASVAARGSTPTGRGGRGDWSGVLRAHLCSGVAFSAPHACANRPPCLRVCLPRGDDAFSSPSPTRLVCACSSGGSPAHMWRRLALAFGRQHAYSFPVHMCAHMQHVYSADDHSPLPRLRAYLSRQAACTCNVVLVRGPCRGCRHPLVMRSCRSGAVCRAAQTGVGACWLGLRRRSARAHTGHLIGLRTLLGAQLLVLCLRLLLLHSAGVRKRGRTAGLLRSCCYHSCLAAHDC